MENDTVFIFFFISGQLNQNILVGIFPIVTSSIAKRPIRLLPTLVQRRSGNESKRIGYLPSVQQQRNKKMHEICEYSDIYSV